jgi:choline kinase
MKAIILAAGQGKRLNKFHQLPKAFIKVPKIGLTLIERNIAILRKNGVKEFLIVTGYKSNMFKKLIAKDVTIKKVENYKQYNNYYSLLSVKKEIKGHLIILFSDILVNERIINRLNKSKKKICLVIDKNKKLNDTMRVTLKKNKINDIGNHITPKTANGNFIGIAKFNFIGSNILKKNLKNNKFFYKDYYVRALDEPIKKNMVSYIDVRKKFWIEIDNHKDLKKLSLITSQNLK